MPIGQIKAELECSIYASRNEDGTDPIPNGGWVGNPPIWLHYTVKNTGLKDAKNFQVTMVAANTYFLIHNHTEQDLSLSGTAKVKTFSVKVSGIQLPFSYNKIEAFMLVDVLDTIPEEREWNNFSSFGCGVVIIK